jgi:hypothetical protein
MHSSKVILLVFCFLAIGIKVNGQWKSSSAYGFYSISVTHNTLFATIGDGSQQYKGIFRSTDFGKSWELKSNGIPQNADICQIISDSVDTYLVTRFEGIYKTTDNGDTWFSISSDSRVQGGSLALLSASTMLSAKNGHLMVTTNGGTSWDTSKTGLPSSLTIMAVTGYPGHFIIGTMGSGVFESTNNGSSWSPLNTGFSSATGTTRSFSRCQGNRLYTVQNDGKLYQLSYPKWSVVSTTPIGTPTCIGYYNGSLYAATMGSAKIFCSTNNGTSWTGGTPTTASNAQILSLFPLNNSLLIAIEFAAGYNGLFSTADRCTTFTQLSCGPSSGVNTIFVYQNNRFFAGNCLSTDSCKSWKIRNTGLPTGILSMTNFGDTVLAGTQGNTSANACVYRSVDDGVNWTYVGSGFSIVNATVPSVYRWNDKVFASANDGIYVSTNKGTTWIKKFTKAGVASITSDGDKIFGAIQNAGYGVAISTDGGDTWNWFNSGINMNASGSSIVCQNGKLFFGTLNYGIYASTDNGATWKTANAGLPSTFDVTALAVEGDYIFAGIYAANTAKIYYSSDGGASWVDFSAGLMPTYKIYSIKAFNGKIYAAAGVGLMHRNFSEITGMSDKNISFRPADVSLGQNYPNPFNPSTTIKYQLKENGFVRLMVYNLLGREVYTLVNEEKAAGTYEVKFNAEGLTSGVYFYTLRAGKYTETKKLMILK